MDGSARLVSIWNSSVFRNKAEAAVWAWMIDCAALPPRTILTKSGRFAIESGEIVYTERDLATEFCMHRNTVRHLLKRMFDAGMIIAVDHGLPHQAGTWVRINEQYDENLPPLPRSVSASVKRDIPSNRHVREQIFEKTSGRCTYCDCELTLEPGPNQFHVDHIKPSSRGGKDRIGNLTAACRTCNIKKGNRRKFVVSPDQIPLAGSPS